VQEMSVDDKLCDSRETRRLFMWSQSPEPASTISAIKPSTRKLGFL
jgi:hypothetical protein